MLSRRAIDKFQTKLLTFVVFIPYCGLTLQVQCAQRYVIIFDAAVGCGRGAPRFIFISSRRGLVKVDLQTIGDLFIFSLLSFRIFRIFFIYSSVPQRNFVKNVQRISRLYIIIVRSRCAKYNSWSNGYIYLYIYTYNKISSVCVKRLHMHRSAYRWYNFGSYKLHKILYFIIIYVTIYKILYTKCNVNIWKDFVT